MKRQRARAKPLPSHQPEPRQRGHAAEGPANARKKRPPDLGGEASRRVRERQGTNRRATGNSEWPERSAGARNRLFRPQSTPHEAGAAWNFWRAIIPPPPVSCLGLDAISHQARPLRMASDQKTTAWRARNQQSLCHHLRESAGGACLPRRLASTHATPICQ